MQANIIGFNPFRSKQFNCLPDNKILALSKLKAIADDNFRQKDHDGPISLTPHATQLSTLWAIASCFMLECFYFENDSSI